MSASNDDFLFAQEAQALGYVTEAQVEEGLKLQRIMAEELKIDERLDVILVKRGWLAEEQARRVHARVEPEGRKTEIPGYRLLERLGRGAMGTVYRGLHLGLQRVVAIKVLHKDLATDTTQVRRLQAEAKLLASLDHPNIVRALDAGESNGFPYVVMEYVEGETLRERLAKQGRLPEAEALRITRGLADALERARRMGVVHRDVKPGNVLLTRQGEPKLMDLGLAKGPVDLELTQHGATVGTPQYISPEQAQDPRRADIRSDIYSLGATLYALVTGRPPFDGSTLAEILSKVLYETPTPPRLLNPEVSAEVGYLIERMMLKDPSLRYHTPAEVVDDIDRILAGRSIMPAGFRGNWEAFLLRRRIRRWSIVGAVSLAAALALTFGARAWISARDAEQARERGREQARLLLPEVAYGPSDRLLSVQQKLGRLETALSGDLQSVDLPEVDALKARREQLKALLACLQRWHNLLGDALAARPDESGSVAWLEARRDFRDALAKVADFEPFIAPPGTENPVYVLVEKERSRLLQASRESFQELVQKARSRHAATLEEWSEGWDEFGRGAESGYIPEGETDSGVKVAASLRAASAEILNDVKRFESLYSRQNLEDRLKRLQVEGLLTEIDTARGEVLLRTQNAWREQRLEWTPLAVLVSQPAGLVTSRLDAVMRRLHEQVAAHGRDWVERLRKEPGPALLSQVQRFHDQIVRGGFREAAEELRKALAQYQDEEGARERERTKAWEAVFDRWLGDLRRVQSDTPKRLDDDLALSPEDEAALDTRRGDVDDLKAANRAVERLYALALETLRGMAEKRQRLVPRLRSGTAPEKGWLLQSVDPDSLSFDVQGVSARESPRHALTELAPAQILDLATRSRSEPADRLALAVGALALLPPQAVVLKPDTDLREPLKGYTAAQRAFEDAGVHGALARHVAAVLTALEQAGKEAEATAEGRWKAAEKKWGEHRYSGVKFELDGLLENARLRGTTFFTEYEARIRAMWKQLNETLEADNIGRWLPGVKAERVGEGVWRILYDFDSDDQGRPENFDRVKGVLEPFAGAVATPGPATGQRLHLLRGFSEPSREFPLAWRSIFDPSQPITVAFDLFVLDKPYFLGVDVDGLQVGVLCLDPAWFPDFRLPSGVPLLEGEKQVPRHDVFGLGRGVAFHGGPDFGDPATWSSAKGGTGTAWPAEGRGHRLAALGGRLDSTGPLFAFPPSTQVPGHGPYKVKVVRQRDRITLFVDDVEVASERREAWGRIGTGDPRSGMSNGSGHVQILTFTPMAIDNLELIGAVKPRWLEEQQKKDQAANPR